MSLIYKCDGCGKTHEGQHKPREWFVRTHPELKKDIHACSRECVETVNATDKKPMPIAPI